MTTNKQRRYALVTPMLEQAKIVVKPHNYQHPTGYDPERHPANSQTSPLTKRPANNILPGYLMGEIRGAVSPAQNNDPAVKKIDILPEPRPNNPEISPRTAISALLAVTKKHWMEYYTDPILEVLQASRASLQATNNQEIAPPRERLAWDCNADKNMDVDGNS